MDMIINRGACGIVYDDKISRQNKCHVATRGGDRELGSNGRLVF